MWSDKNSAGAGSDSPSVRTGVEPSQTGVEPSQTGVEPSQTGVETGWTSVVLRPEDNAVSVYDVPMSENTGVPSDNTGESGQIMPDDIAKFAKAFVELSEFSHQLQHRDTGAEQVRDVVMAHLGTDPGAAPAVSHRLQPVDRPSLQLALDELLAVQPETKLIGLDPELSHYGGFSFSALFTGHFRGPSNVAPPVYDNLPIDVDETLRCAAAGIWLLFHHTTPVVVTLMSGERHGPPGMESPRLEVFAADVEVARAFLASLLELRTQHNVYRGKVLFFGHAEDGEFGLTFLGRPDVTAADVILPAETLESIERHTLGIGARADQLRAAGQHLKRGVLLHGPPGTGKTHTINYLLNAMPERTVVILQGSSIGALGYGAAIVRNLSPAMLVIEDIDIIAHERGSHFGGPGHPLLFELLNEMDGLNPSSDVLFLLTTNRPEVLEPALAARPGRIDHAVEIARPDAVDRLRLLELYLPDVGGLSVIDEVVERTGGTTASFVKELVRRATYVALETTGEATIADDHLLTALDEMLTDQPLSRGLFGAGDGDGDGDELGVRGPGGHRYDEPPGYSKH